MSQDCGWRPGDPLNERDEIRVGMPLLEILSEEDDPDRIAVARWPEPLREHNLDNRA